MKCIVTAGPSYEPLDTVRRLTNFSTGALGTELANFLFDQGHGVQLFRGRLSNSAVPIRVDGVEVFETGADLSSRLQAWSSKEVEAVFHVAAVCDFTAGNVWHDEPDGTRHPLSERKISSRSGTITVELIPAPKIIARLRDWFPNAKLAGWKYEADGDRGEAQRRAEMQIREFRTDAVVANGPAYGDGFGFQTTAGPWEHLQHKGLLFQRLLEFLSG